MLKRTILEQFKKGLHPNLDALSIRQVYFLCKAHKLVAPEHFYAMWNDGRSKAPLTRVLHAFYPPLEPNHPLEKGMDGLDQYVEIAKEIFQ